MRALYRADPQLWIDLVEQAALEGGDVVLVCDECGPERPEAGEALVRCHRRVLRALLVSVATARGLLVDFLTDDLRRNAAGGAGTAVLAAEGRPLTCPVCQRAGGHLPGSSAAGMATGTAPRPAWSPTSPGWKAQLWSAGSGRRR